MSTAKYPRMAAVDQVAGETLPIDGFADLTVGAILPRLGQLGPFELHQVRDFESRHLNRRSVLAAIDRLLG